MALERDYLRGNGGLVRLSPLENRSIREILAYGSQPEYHRILGSFVSLGYLKHMLEHPESSREGWSAIWRDVTENLEEIIGALSEQPEEYTPFDVNTQVRETIMNYFEAIGKPITLPESRRKFQDYAMLLENCYKKRILSPPEAEEKQDVLQLLQFFERLEENYGEWKFHHPHPDGIPLR